MRALRKLLITSSVATLVTAVVGWNAAWTTHAADGGGDVFASTSATQSLTRPAPGFRLNFDSNESLRPGTRVRDSSGNRNRATVLVSGRGRLTREDGLVRAGVGFPAGCRRCGRAILQINDRRTLDPRRDSFRFGGAVKVPSRQARDGRDPNIVQKGLAREPGGQFKLELLGGARPRCVISGRRGEVRTPRGPSIADGTWHQVTCVRRGQLVTLRIDRVIVASATGATGRVANSAPVRIGGKATGSAGQNDQYHGDLDSVFLRINR